MRNGLRSILHTLRGVFPPEVFSPCLPGRRIRIPAPSHVNDRVVPLKGEPELSSPLIVPLPAVSDKGATVKEYLARTTSRRGRPNPIRVPAHSIEPAFAVTYNQMHGATVDRLILVLNDLADPCLGTMTLGKLYVGFSRVRRDHHLAIFSASNDALHHLLPLNHDQSLCMWDSLCD